MGSLNQCKLTTFDGRRPCMAARIGGLSFGSTYGLVSSLLPLGQELLDASNYFLAHRACADFQPPRGWMSKGPVGFPGYHKHLQCAESRWGCPLRPMGRVPMIEVKMIELIVR
jgi:hypothetical protein